MRTIGRTASLVVAVLLAVATAGLAPDPPEPPLLATPPHQSDPWKPPETKLPRFFVAATRMLFDQGLADPRGCEYRTIRITPDPGFRRPDEVDCKGWVLPVSGGGKPRHAIAWNGLVYPLIEAGEPADLAADVRELVAATRPKGRDAWPPYHGEVAAASPATFQPIKICLLLRLGRADLAEACWSAGVGPLPARDGFDLNSYGVSYLTLATDLAWYRFDRAVRAHETGDDPLALADARMLEPMARDVEAAAERMGFDKPSGKSRYLDFLGPLPALRSDQERRARERATPPAQAEGPEARARALVGKLDQAAPTIVIHPGGVQWDTAKAVEELIDEGEAAVDPLIECLRSDERLTRTVSDGRHINRFRLIHPVYEPAYVALMGILKGFPQPTGSRGLQSRKELADRIQAYWDKNRSIAIAERWYATLADDDAGHAAWLESAGLIAQPRNVQSGRAGAFLSTTIRKLKPGETPRLRGEPLRDGRSPSVEELMKRRIESMRGSEGDSAAMAEFLKIWRDPKAAARAAEAG